MKKSILAGQPGGPTAVISTSLYGVVAEGMARPEEVGHVYDMVNGTEDSLSGHAMDLSSLTREDLILLKQTPVTYLGSCWFKLPENLDVPAYSLLFEKFKSMNIGACFYTGGNDSMNMIGRFLRCAWIHRKSISFIEVPRTIDNDLPVTDYTPGYGSTAKYVTSTVREISLNAFVYQQSAVTIVELMGCHAGWVTAATTLAKKFPGDNPFLIYMLKMPFPVKQFFKNVEQILSRQPSVVVCILEGICDKNGCLICEYTNDAQIDTSGHKMSTGCAKTLESYVRSRFQIKVHSVELDVNQHCSDLLAFTADMQEAESSGRTAVEKALQGETGKIVTCSRLSGSGYGFGYGLTEIGNVCNREESFLVEWIAAEDSGVGPEFLDYAPPLIQGQPDRIMENGLPKYLCRK